jgi:membrane protein YdbS with pleckstrin-like domain
VPSGAALSLEPDTTYEYDANAIAVYHEDRKIGYIAAETDQISHVLRPGFEYEAMAGYLEYDEEKNPVILNIEVVIYGDQRPEQAHRAGPISKSSDIPVSVKRAEDSHGQSSSYHRSPVMFRAHPIGFILSVLLVPVVLGAVILLVWRIRSKTTHLEIDQQSVRYETGVFSKDRRALSRRAIRTVRVTQTLLNRMLNVGDIEIFTAGDVPEIRARSIYAPNEIRELLGG